MYLENLVVDAADPQSLGRFWEAAVDGETLTDAPGIFETRVSVDGGPELDLCFQPVSDPSTEHPRVLVGLTAAPGRDEGAHTDPEGNAYLVVADTGDGPLVSVALASADPARDAAFWAWLTGWSAVGSGGPLLRHPSGRGHLLAFVPEAAPKGPSKNRMHLDLRLETQDDREAVVAGILERGGRELSEQWGELPWRTYQDPSGNEFCLLPAR